MEFILDRWSERDGKSFQMFLDSKKRTEKIEWTRKIINTKMPLLAIPTPELKKIAREIYKGDYLSFLDLSLNYYYENTIINGMLITKIKDFNLLKKYLNKYTKYVDNWASCDLLSFNIKGKEKEFFDLSMEYIKSSAPFTRRIGVIIWFNYISKKEYLKEIFDVIKTMKNEDEYYVNMALAWFIAECFIKQREMTLQLLDLGCLNRFTVNKAVQKCRDSYRVSKEDKEYLLRYKI